VPKYYSLYRFFVQYADFHAIARSFPVHVNQSINNIIKYIQSHNKQRQATRKAKRLNELAAEYNLNVAIIYNKQIRRKRKKKEKNSEEV